jgi:hypothetical protein
MTSMTSPGIPTPPASSVAPSQYASSLPQPRRHPLKPGGPKESELIRYLDHGINNIQKRVDNRTTNRKLNPVLGEEVGYGTFADVAKDLDALVDVVWVSGSRMLFDNDKFSPSKLTSSQRIFKYPTSSTLPSSPPSSFPCSPRPTARPRQP